MILITDISDHLPILTLCGETKYNQPKKTSHTYRPITIEKINTLKERLVNIDWTHLENKSAESGYTSFSNTLQETIDSYVPVKTTLSSAKAIKHEPWLTKGILKSSKTLKKLYRKKLKNPNSLSIQFKYKSYRNLLNKIKRKAKQSYLGSQLQLYKNNIRETWKILNNSIGKLNDKSNIIDKITVNQEEIYDPTDISNKFLNHFSSIGAKLANGIKQTANSAESYMANPNTHSIYLSPTDQTEIEDIITGLKAKNTIGLDGISTKLLKMIKSEISAPVSILINKSLEEGIFPDELKLTMIIPIYKSKLREILDNYRPISILPAISKIFEKVMFKRLYIFLVQHNILFKGQYGFRPQHSTIDAITEFTDRVNKALENKEIAMGIFLDLSKAFDTIDHNLLLYKLSHYGIRGKALDWFKSYLTNRTLTTSVNNVQSSYTETLTFGVPQGSILGPLLFIIYINDLPNVLEKCIATIFADDNSLFYSHKDIHLLTKFVNSDLQLISTWFQANKLSLNPNKTVCIIFTSKKCSLPKNIEIKLDNTRIEIKTSTKFLGVIIDRYLDWHDHINSIIGKLNSANYILSRVKYILPKEHLKTLYYSLVQPYLTYGITLWGATHTKYLNKLRTLQKKALRIINRVSYQHPTNKLFLENQILKLDDLYQLEVAKYLYKFSIKKLPINIQNLFTPLTSIHTYNTRNKKNPQIPLHRSSSAFNSITHKGPVIWQTIPNCLKSMKTLNSFKYKFKQHLLLKY